MFRFEDPQYLYLLAAIPVLAIIRYLTLRGRRKRLRTFGDPKLLRQLMPDVSKVRPELKFWLLETALAMLILMVARPQFGTKISNEKRKGIEAIIAMDISNSMKAEDVTPNRLSRCKMMVENMVERFENDKIGLIVFAGDAFVQLPITADYVSAKMFLESIDPSMMSVQGTDIALAIQMASHSFTPEQGVGKAIIVITDGEDHEGGAIEAAEEAKKKGMRVYVLGVGSPNGAPIPEGGQGNYMRDNMGNTVMTRLNEDMCKQIARAGGGAYIHVSNNSNAQEQLSGELEKLAKKETESLIYSEYDEQFQAFGVVALLLIILEILILERRNRVLGRISLFGKKGTTIILLALMASIPSVADEKDAEPEGVAAPDSSITISPSEWMARKYIREGNRLFRSGNYKDAEVAYRKANERNPKNPQALYNLGTSLLMQNQDSSAVAALEKAAKMETNPIRRAMAFHNIGVICQKLQMFKEAIDVYKEALRNNPKDDTTRYNLQLCKKQLKDDGQDGQQNQQQDQKDDQGDQQKQEQQQDQRQQQGEDKQENKEEQNKMSQDNAEQLLNAAMQQEKETQERMQQVQRQNSKRRLEKNW